MYGYEYVGVVLFRIGPAERNMNINERIATNRQREGGRGRIET